MKFWGWKEMHWLKKLQKAIRKWFYDGIQNLQKRTKILPIITFHRSLRLTKSLVILSKGHSMISMDGRNLKKGYFHRDNWKVATDLVTTLMRYLKNFSTLITPSPRSSIKASLKREVCLVMLLDPLIIKKSIKIMIWLLWFHVHYLSFT